MNTDTMWVLIAIVAAILAFSPVMPYNRPGKDKD
jgi:hypothetical protein